MCYIVETESDDKEQKANHEESAPVERSLLDLADLLAAAGLAPAALTESLSATITSMTDSVALSCDRYTALLVLTRTAHDAEGRAIARQTLRMIADGLTYGA